MNVADVRRKDKDYMTNTIRSKFRVQEINDNIYKSYNTSEGDIPEQKYGEVLRMSPVYSPDPESENHSFWKATPNGELKMYVDNPQAWGKFQVGQEYYLDFTLAD